MVFIISYLEENYSEEIYKNSTRGLMTQIQMSTIKIDNNHYKLIYEQNDNRLSSFSVHSELHIP